MSVDNRDGTQLEMMQLEAGTDEIERLAVQVNSHADALEGMRALAAVTSTSAEKDMADVVQAEVESVQEASGVMDQTGHGFLLKEKHIYVSGTLRPHYSNLEGGQERRQTSAVVLKESKDNEPSTGHHLAAFADTFGGRKPNKTAAHSKSSMREGSESSVTVSDQSSSAVGPQTELQALLQESLVMLEYSEHEKDTKQEAPSPAEAEEKPKNSQITSSSQHNSRSVQAENWSEDNDDSDEWVLGDGNQDDTGTDGAKAPKEVTQEIEGIEKKENEALEKDEAALDKLQEATNKETAVPFEETKAGKGFHPNAKKLVDQWDTAYTMKNVTVGPVASGKPAKYDQLNVVSMNITKNISDFISDSVAGEKAGVPLTWGVRRGAAKNFNTSPKLRIKKLADISGIKRVDAFSVNDKSMGVVLHGNALSKFDVSSGSVVAMAGSTKSGAADGAGTSSTFNKPQDVSVFEDPKEQGSWFAVVADTENDNLRLVKNIASGDVQVTTVLKEKMIVKPRRIAALMAAPTDIRNAGVKKIYVFVACGQRTIVRIENVLGRKRTEEPQSAYQVEAQKLLDKKDKELWNMDNNATLHILSETDFEGITGIAAVSVRDGKATRELVFVSCGSFKAIYRMEHVLHGERRAKVVKMVAIEHPGDLIVLGYGATWFALVTDKRQGHNVLRRVDGILDGEELGRVSSVPGGDKASSKSVEGGELLKSQGILGLAGGLEWTGNLLGTAQGPKGSFVFHMDLTVPLQCKERTLLGSAEFQELGEMQDLGDVKVSDKAMYLYDFVAKSLREKKETEWTVVNYFAEGNQVCAVATAGNSRHNTTAEPELLVPYFCKTGTCWPL